MALNGGDTFNKTAEVIQFLKNGEQEIRISQIKDIVMLLGRTGSGKSTLVRFITGNDESLEAVEVGEDTGEFLIIDKNGKVCKTTTESCTTVPELVVDKATGMPFYDNPGNGDTRTLKHDLSVTYFIQKVIGSADAVKLVFTESFPSVRRGVERANFLLLVKNAVSMIKNLDKYKDSIALIVTKVDNSFFMKNGEPVLVSDEKIIQNIVDFLNETKDTLESKTPTDHIGKSMIRFIDILLTKKENEYPRIGIFRRPDKAGKLVSGMELKNKRSLKKIVDENISFTYCDSEDFDNTVSAESLNKLHQLVDEVNKRIAVDVEGIAKDMEEGFLQQETNIIDVRDLYRKFNFGKDVMKNITKVNGSEEPEEFLTKIRETASALSIDVSRKNVDSILHYDRFLKFIHTLTKEPVMNPLKWVAGLSDVAQSFDDSQRWYYFLINLRTALMNHEVQKEISRNTTAVDDLRDQIGAFKDDASPVRNSLRQFLSQVYRENAGSEFNGVKTGQLNSWKLKVLKDMLDFQVLTLCENDRHTVFGSYVHLSDFVRKSCPEAKFVDIFALIKVFIDADYDRTGRKVQMSIFSPTWEVIGSPKIRIDGVPGRNHEMPKAGMRKKPLDSPVVASSTSKHNLMSFIDGLQTEMGVQESNSPFGVSDEFDHLDGDDGLPGFPGGSAGNFVGVGFDCLNCQFLTISANGGNGGDGQDGEDGKNGRDGRRPPRYNSYTNKFNFVVTVSHEDRGNQGVRGGNGGMGGEGGIGGKPGIVDLVMFNTPEPTQPKISANFGSSGVPGQSGKAGQGGKGEHYVESHTYLFGLHLWSNGVVSHDVFSSRNGESATGLNDEGQEDSEPSVALVHPSHAINEYKAYLRENLSNSFSRISLGDFLNQMETSKKLIAMYDTLGLVNDLQFLEKQYFKLHRHTPLLPFYKSLLERIDTYARDKPFWMIAGEHKKVLAFLYMSTLSKICTINNNMNNDLIINVKDYFPTVVKEVDQMLKGFMVTNRRNERRSALEKGIKGKMTEANRFIKEDITRESQAVLVELNSLIQALVAETRGLQDLSRKEEKRLNEYMVTRGIASVAKFASRALDFFGVFGLAAEGVLESTNLISSTLGFGDQDSNGDNQLEILLQKVSDFFRSAPDFFLDKIKTFVNQLADVDKILSGVLNIGALNETRGVFSKALEEFSKASENHTDLFEDLEKMYDKREELVNLVQDKKESIGKMVAKGNPESKKAMVALSHTEQILKLPQGVYSLLGKNKIHDLGKVDASEKLLRLEEYERKIFDVIAPMCKNLKNLFSEISPDSHAALDVSKWKIQRGLSDVKAHIMAMTEGFQVQGPMAATIDKLNFGLSTMIQVYDRIQTYHDQLALADYMADIASDQAKEVQVTERELSDAMDSLQMIMKTNLILAEYEKAMNAFGQYVLPFARMYLEEYELPSSLKAGNSTDEMLSEAVYVINSLERKLAKDNFTIMKNYDEIVYQDVFFTRNQQGPFFIWKYESVAKQIVQLLEGKEVLLHADVTHSIDNAVKFNDIGIRFRLANNDEQHKFDAVMDQFTIEMNHLGLSYYRCAHKFYVLTHDSLKMTHSVNEDKFGRFSNYNGVYDKISSNEPLISPYTMWKVKLRPVRGNFRSLEKYKTEIIDLALEGRGSFVDRKVDGTLCVDTDKYYRVDDTISEVPNVDYKTVYNVTPLIDTRRRRSIENAELLQEISAKEENRGVFNPLHRFVSWLTRSSPPTHDNPPSQNSSDPDFTDKQIDYPTSNDQFFTDLMYEETVDSKGLPVLDDPTTKLPIGQVNYDMINTHSNLLLLDMLTRMKTGAKRVSKENYDDYDDESAQKMAYSFYAPANDENSS